MNFRGSDTSIILNSNDNTTHAFLTLYDDNTVWTGNGTTDIVLENGKNLVFNGGSGSIHIQGYTAPINNESDQGNTLILFPRLELTGNGSGTGDVTYTQENESVSIYNQYGKISAQLGPGTATISLGSLYGGYDIDIGDGNVILNDYTPIVDLDHTLSLSLPNQSISQVEYHEGNTIFHLSTHNSVTFVGVDLKDNNPFAVT